MAKRKSYSQMSDDELNDANIALQEEKDEIRDEQLQINEVLSQRATDKAVKGIVSSMSPEQAERVGQAIKDAGAIKSEEKSGSGK